MEYIRSVAKENHKEKIILDVHKNLRFFEAYFRNEGFIVTGRKFNDNPCWLEAEYIIEYE